MQQKMMKYMTGFMGLLFYKVASGLCLYFIASSLWGLGERRLLKKAESRMPARAAAAADSSPRNRFRPPPAAAQNGSQRQHRQEQGRPKAKRKR